METAKGKIHTPDRARQLRDFSGLRFGNITPTDIDGLIEYKDLAYVIIELKYAENELHRGQRLALERLTDDLERSKKSTLCIIASHETFDAEDEIDAANAIVTEYRLRGVWRQGKSQRVVDLVKPFLANHNSDIPQSTAIKPDATEYLKKRSHLVETALEMGAQIVDSHPNPANKEEPKPGQQTMF